MNVHKALITMTAAYIHLTTPSQLISSGSKFGQCESPEGPFWLSVPQYFVLGWACGLMECDIVQ